MLSDKELVEQYEARELLTSIFDGFGRDDEGDALVAQLAKLHNSGRIDLISLLESPSLEKIEGPRFFTGQHAYCRIIPLLNDDVDRVMKAVHVLVAKGANDMAAGSPNAAFREWCKVSPDRSTQVIDGAKNDDPVSLDCLTFALEAHELIDDAVNFATTEIGLRQRAGVVALGRMALPNASNEKKAISALRTVAKTDADYLLRANVLRSAFNIVEKSDGATIVDLYDVIVNLCAKPGDQFHYACSSVLFFHTSLLDDRTIDLIFQTLLTFNPANKGTVKELDNGLHAILETEHDKVAIQFVKDLVLTHRDGLSLSEFERFCRALISGPAERFSSVFVSWLLSAELPLCEGLSLVLRGSEAAEKAVSLSFADFDLTSDQFVFLCRKAIGYFFVQSVFVGSVITSVLRVCDQEASARIGQLLYDPMLINFGGALREFLEKVDEDDKACEPVGIALANAGEYLKGLKSVGWIKEIVPSEREKLMEQQRFSDQMRDAHKQAEKKSVFYDIFSRSVLLYGRGSISYIKGTDGERRAIETEMKSFSTSMELPRQEVVDPVGLDLMLRIFRVERMRP